MTDDQQNSYLLGLRDMVNKSGNSVLETLKDILTDISECCHSLFERREFGVGYDLLNIKSTMSDRASTEKYFNKLLVEYTMTVLPDIIDNYHQLSN